MDKEMKNQVVGEFTRKVKITGADIDYVLCGALEGGIDCWGYMKRDPNKPQGLPSSSWATELLLAGKSITIVEEEENEEYELTLEKLLNGIQRNATHRPQDSDLENADAITYDCIVQYALFNDVVYG